MIITFVTVYVCVCVCVSTSFCVYHCLFIYHVTHCMIITFVLWYAVNIINQSITAFLPQYIVLHTAQY